MQCWNRLNNFTKQFEKTRSTNYELYKISFFIFISEQIADHPMSYNIFFKFAQRVLLWVKEMDLVFFKAYQS